MTKIFLLLLLTVFVGTATARTCFCDIRTGPSRTSPLFLDGLDKVYHHWLHVTCSYAKSHCPDDCRRSAASSLGGSVHPLDNAAGNEACDLLNREVTPDNPVHLYAHWKTSSCENNGHTGYHYLGEVCCWRVDFGPGYLHNVGCSQNQHPITGEVYPVIG